MRAHAQAFADRVRGREPAADMRAAEGQARRKGRSFLPRFWRYVGRSVPAKISVVILLILVTMILFAPWIARYPAQEQHLRERFQTPSSTYWLGSDELGRDIYSRIVWGSRISVIIGATSVLMGLVTGVTWACSAATSAGSWTTRCLPERPVAAFPAYSAIMIH